MTILGTIASSYLQATNSYFSIATTEVTSGGSSFIEFTSIPATYKHLQLRIHARGATSAAHITTYVTFNSDTGTNYSSAEIYATAGGAIGSGQGVNETSITYGPFFPAGSQSASIFGYGVMDIFDYTNTSICRTVTHWSGYENNASTGSPSYSHILWRDGTWENTASAISSIKLAPNNGNWAQYSRFSLYGIKGA